MKARLAVVISLSAAVGALATWTMGLWPGDDPRATVDHCYITYDRQENRHGRCVGNWTRGGHGHRGPINGIAISTSWRVLSTDPDAAYEWEVAVPESQRQPRVLADDRQAWVASFAAARWSLVPAAAGGLLVALAWSITWLLVARRRSCRSRNPAPHGS